MRGVQYLGNIITSMVEIFCNACINLCHLHEQFADIGTGTICLGKREKHKLFADIMVVLFLYHCYLTYGQVCNLNISNF